MPDTRPPCEVCGVEPADRVVVDHPTSPELLREGWAIGPTVERLACPGCDDGCWDESWALESGEDLNDEEAAA